MTSLATQTRPFELTLSISERVTQKCYIIGGRSRLTSSTDPQIEIIVRYPRRFSAAQSQLVYDGTISKTGRYGSRRNIFINLLRGPITLPHGIPCLDIRPLHIANWSHALNQAIPLSLMVRDRIRDFGGESLNVVVPTHAPRNVIHLFEILGFTCFLTNSSTFAQHVRLEPLQGQIIHQNARKWIEPHMPAIRLLLKEVGRDLPRKIFIDRRSGRNLLNADKVSSMLSHRGFTTVYPEDLSPEEQIALLQKAEDIVAIHGAGLAPLLYRTPEDGPFRLIEILSPGDLKLFFRDLTLRLPVDYRAVRGNPGVKMLAEAYRTDKTGATFKKNHAMASFVLDLEALELALRPQRIEDTLEQGLPIE